MTQELLEGFKRFHEETYEGRGAVMPRLVKEGQNPDYFIISCIDSRSNPGTIFRPAPGTFFAHKAMGAIVRPYNTGTALAGALQFALIHNNVRQIVILGHTGCGAIRALVDKVDDPEISSFIDVAQAALPRARALCGDNSNQAAFLRKTEEQIVLQSAENLRTYPSVAKLLGDGVLTISPWLFDMETGNLMAYNNDKKIFEAITDYDHTKAKTAHKCSHC
jgi:carbonic anhydrase